MKAIKVLKALVFGQEVDIEGRTYALGEDEKGEYCLVIKCFTWRDGKKMFQDEPEIEWHKAHFTLDYFLNLCETLNDDDLFILSAERALTQINRGE